MVEIVLFGIYIVHILSLVFIPVDKKPFYTYLLIAGSTIVFLWAYLIYELKYCPSYWGYFSFVLLSPFILISTIFLLIKIGTKLINDKDLRDYVAKKIQYKLFSKSLKVFVSMFILFQVFLLLSANKAYNEAKKLNIEYVKGKTMLDFYRPSFYKPFVKEIYINSDTRWSYHRVCYIDEWE